MIKNQELANQILKMMNTAIEAVEEMMLLLNNQNIEEFNKLGEDLFSLIKSIRVIADELKVEEEGLNLPAASQSVMVSLVRILKIVKKDKNQAAKKVEFELLPLIEEMRVTFYYWGMVYPDSEKIKRYYEEEIHLFGGNRYTKQAELTGKYKYELSIFIQGYNKKNYTALCLQSLYENLPKEISYEIILLNHGSNDGTKELFESYHPDKQLDISVNGGGSNAVFRITEGKYIVAISNDVLVTKNSIINLYKCINHDNKIAWVVPTTPNIANLQTPQVYYTNIEEMKEFAQKNNISDCYRWEQRVRLCNPIDIMRASFAEKTKVQYIYNAKNQQSFPDDKKSLVCRRNGYKMYLAKDAFCHHFGKVTLKDDKIIHSNTAYEEGRKKFANVFGIDPWGKGFCFSPELMVKLECANLGEVHILGIETGLGSNPLKIKEKIKENVHNTNVKIKNITTEKKYIQDLCGVSDEVMLIKSHEVLFTFSEKYDYIVNETLFSDKNIAYKEIKMCQSILKENGICILLIKNDITLEKESEYLGKFKNIEKVSNITMPSILDASWIILYK